MSSNNKSRSPEGLEKEAFNPGKAVEKWYLKNYGTKPVKPYGFPKAFGGPNDVHYDISLADRKLQGEFLRKMTNLSLLLGAVGLGQGAVRRIIPELKAEVPKPKRIVSAPGEETEEEKERKRLLGIKSAGVEDGLPFSKEDINFDVIQDRVTGQHYAKSNPLFDNFIFNTLWGGKPTNILGARLGPLPPGSTIPVAIAGSLAAYVGGRKLSDTIANKLRDERIEKEREQLEEEFDELLTKRSSLLGRVCDNMVDQGLEKEAVGERAAEAARRMKTIITGAIKGLKDLPGSATLPTAGPALTGAYQTYALASLLAAYTAGAGLRRRYDPGRVQQKAVDIALKRRDRKDIPYVELDFAGIGPRAERGGEGRYRASLPVIKDENKEKDEGEIVSEYDPALAISKLGMAKAAGPITGAFTTQAPQVPDYQNPFLGGTPAPQPTGAVPDVVTPYAFTNQAPVEVNNPFRDPKALSSQRIANLQGPNWRNPIPGSQPRRPQTPVTHALPPVPEPTRPPIQRSLLSPYGPTFGMPGQTQAQPQRMDPRSLVPEGAFTYEGPEQYRDQATAEYYAPFLSPGAIDQQKNVRPQDIANQVRELKRGVSAGHLPLDDIAGPTALRKQISERINQLSELGNFTPELRTDFRTKAMGDIRRAWEARQEGLRPSAPPAGTMVTPDAQGRMQSTMPGYTPPTFDLGAPEGTQFDLAGRAYAPPADPSAPDAPLSYELPEAVEADLADIASPDVASPDVPDAVPSEVVVPQTTQEIAKPEYRRTGIFLGDPRKGEEVREWQNYLTAKKMPDMTQSMYDRAARVTGMGPEREQLAGAPDAPDVPTAPNAPDVPDVPTAPGLPDAPDEFPKISSYTEAPDIVAMTKRAMAEAILRGALIPEEHEKAASAQPIAAPETLEDALYFLGIDKQAAPEWWDNLKAFGGRMKDRVGTVMSGVDEVRQAGGLSPFLQQRAPDILADTLKREDVQKAIGTTISDVDIQKILDNNPQMVDTLIDRAMSKFPRVRGALDFAGSVGDKIKSLWTQYAKPAIGGMAGLFGAGLNRLMGIRQGVQPPAAPQPAAAPVSKKPDFSKYHDVWTPEDYRKATAGTTFETDPRLGMAAPKVQGPAPKGTYGWDPENRKLVDLSKRKVEKPTVVMPEPLVSQKVKARRAAQGG